MHPWSRYLKLMFVRWTTCSVANLCLFVGSPLVRNAFYQFWMLCSSLGATFRVLTITVASPVCYLGSPKQCVWMVQLSLFMLHTPAVRGFTSKHSPKTLSPKPSKLNPKKPYVRIPTPYSHASYTVYLCDIRVVANLSHNSNSCQLLVIGPIDLQ